MKNMKLKLELLNIKNMNIDKILTILSVFYVVLPVIFFLLFWTKLWISLIGSILIIYGSIKIINEINDNDDTILICKKNIKPILLIIIFTFIFMLFSGIGGIGAQRFDYYVRNPIYYDLNNMSWPLMYNFSKDNPISYIFSGDYMFVYYLAYWLPVSFISKLLHLPQNVADILLMLFVFWGLLLIIFNICKHLKCIKYIMILFLLFSGIDIIGGIVLRLFIYLKDNGFDLAIVIDEIKLFLHSFMTIETYAQLYNSITTYEDIMISIYNVFNQSVCVYLIMSLFLRLKSNKYVAFLLSLIFVYSPWSMVGAMLYIFAGSFGKNKKFVDIFNIVNICVPLLIIVVFVPYYVLSPSVSNEHEIIFIFDNRLMLVSIVSIIFEWLIYVLLIVNKKIKYDYMYVTLFYLLLFDIVFLGDRNMNMRGVMPAIFLLSIYVLQFLIKSKELKICNIRRNILIVLLVISLTTPISLVSQGVIGIINGTNIVNPIKSFEHPQLFEDTNEGDYYFNVVKNQFFADVYKDSVFYKYIMRK